MDFNQDYATVGFPLANNARNCGRRHDAVLSNDQMPNLKKEICCQIQVIGIQRETLGNECAWGSNGKHLVFNVNLISKRIESYAKSG